MVERSCPFCGCRFESCRSSYAYDTEESNMPEPRLCSLSDIKGVTPNIITGEIADMKKYNETKKTYEPYSVPEEWNCPITCYNMRMYVNCVRCGKEIMFGDGYTSMQIHNDYGLGYTVCEECHEKEWQERKKTQKK